MSEDKDGATEAYEIMWAAMPQIVRRLAKNAREREDPAERNEAIRVLVERRWLSTRQPTDDDLQQIENMTDDEISDALRRASH